MESVIELRLVTESPEATDALGRTLGELLRPGVFLGLEGELGAGKTCLVRGLCAGLDVDPRRVSSPTYALVHTYAGRCPVYHVDLYRIADPDEVEATGVLDDAERGVVLLEWIDRAPEILPPGGVQIRIETLGPHARAFWLRCEAPEKGGAVAALMARARELCAGE